MQASVRDSGFRDMLPIMLRKVRRGEIMGADRLKAHHRKAGNIQRQGRMGVEPTHERAGVHATVLKTARPTGTRTPP